MHHAQHDACSALTPKENKACPSGDLIQIYVGSRVVYNFGICQIVQIGKSLAFSCSKTIIILAMLAKNRKIPALNLALRN